MKVETPEHFFNAEERMLGERERTRLRMQHRGLRDGPTAQAGWRTWILHYRIGHTKLEKVG